MTLWDWKGCLLSVTYLPGVISVNIPCLISSSVSLLTIAGLTLTLADLQVSIAWGDDVKSRPVDSKTLALATTNPLSTAVKRPTDGRGLLRNIRTTLEQGLPLQTGFYTAKNLNHFFGTTKAEMQLSTETTILWRMRGLGYVPVREDALSSLGVSRTVIDENDHLSPTGKIYAAIGVSCSCEMRIADIEATFGSNNRSVSDRPVDTTGPYPMPAFPPARDPLGNKVMVYDVRAPSNNRSTIEFVLDSDGNVIQINARVWEL